MQRHRGGVQTTLWLLCHVANSLLYRYPFLPDGSHCLSHCLIVSKDAKAIIPGEIAPVQRPGHSWSRRNELPDHTWDQSRINAVTPMTFLFMQTRVNKSEPVSIPVSNCSTLYLTRTGQAVTLLNLSFYEPETTFKCLNEILYMLTLPALDDLFRDRNTGKIRREWIFVVDNGPAEQPKSPLVKMCLVRLLNFLRLHRITQVSFAEYHSKRNFVERVHAEENRVLSKHGPFDSKQMHPLASTGTKEHKENIEKMCDDIRKCLLHASFGSQSLKAYRGVKSSDYLFTDEHELQTFLDLNEDGKKSFSCVKYKPQKNEILNWLEIQWDVDDNFEGDYMNDYLAITNELSGEKRTAWIDKYTTSLYSVRDVQCRRYELQPMPDYLRWFKTAELHYLPLEERAIFSGPWDNIPGAYLPSRILDLCFSAVQHLNDDIMHQISLLAWVTPKEAKEYYHKMLTDIESQIQSEMERECWENHTLYKTNTKNQLEIMCRKLKIPVTPSLSKHQLTKLICDRDQSFGLPFQEIEPLYSGHLSIIPATISGIYKLTIPKLRSILKYHKHPPFGNRDQLAIKVLLLREGKTVAMYAKEEAQIMDLINLTLESIHNQRYMNVTSHIYRKRQFSTSTFKTSFLPPPHTVKNESDLQNLFHPFLGFLEMQKQQHKLQDDALPLQPKKKEIIGLSDTDLRENISQVGSKIKIQWTKEEIGDTGWKPGWYVATVQGYCNETEIVTVKYASEPNLTYGEDLSTLISDGRIKLLWSPL